MLDTAIISNRLPCHVPFSVVRIELRRFDRKLWGLGCLTHKVKIILPCIVLISIIPPIINTRDYAYLSGPTNKSRAGKLLYYTLLFAWH
jgi:hypothetical protein